MHPLRSAICILLLCASVTFAQQDAKSIARKVDEHYNSLRTVRMNFSEALASAGIQKNESGVLLLKKTGRMRWDYQDPQPKLFVSDGKTAYFYVPGERQARKSSVKKLDDLQSPLRYLLGKSQLEKEFENLTAEQTANGVVLSGVPKHMKDRVQRVRLTVNRKNQIERIEIEEIDGTRTDFKFSNIEENVEIADGQFRFKPPVGVEMVEAEELQP
jgi:outer membrane lipoprotein carrier protein